MRKLVFFCMLGIILAALPAKPEQQRVLVYGGSTASQTALVQQAGGVVLQEFTALNIVQADVPVAALPGLRATGLLITPDGSVEATGGPGPKGAEAPAPSPADINDEEWYPSESTGAALIQKTERLYGDDLTIAIIDSGMPPLEKPGDWTRVTSNTLTYDDRDWRIVYKDYVTSTAISNSSDPYGHGTHILATIADGRPLPEIKDAKTGIAPKSSLAVLRVLDAQGQAPYSRVIAAIDDVIANKDVLDIRVLNMSLQATVQGPYWSDLLNQAVMAAWDAGIVVVVPAGNTGPNPTTVMVPGNVPYVITVGAVKSGRYTDNGVDQLATYSSTGPTESKFIKPDVVIAGSRVLAPLPADSTLAARAGLVKNRAQLTLPHFRSNEPLNYYYLSGTSMATAEVSGLVALLLEDQPQLTNDQVKQRLMATADLALGTDGQAAYSVWQQGAGRVNIAAALNSTSLAAANGGMDITADRDPVNGTHYLGLTEYDEATNTFSYPPLASAGDYASWAGDYASWAGDYASWAGDYASWAGDYASWAGDYASWAGDYASWAGDYASWAGDYTSWAGDYASWAGNLPSD